MDGWVMNGVQLLSFGASLLRTLRCRVIPSGTRGHQVVQGSCVNISHPTHLCEEVLAARCGQVQVGTTLDPVARLL